MNNVFDVLQFLAFPLDSFIEFSSSTIVDHGGDVQIDNDVTVVDVVETNFNNLIKVDTENNFKK